MGDMGLGMDDFCSPELLANKQAVTDSIRKAAERDKKELFYFLELNHESMTAKEIRSVLKKINLIDQRKGR